VSDKGSAQTAEHLALLFRFGVDLIVFVSPNHFSLKRDTRLRDNFKERSRRDFYEPGEVRTR
jgi:hypothetical protein